MVDLNELQLFLHVCKAQSFSKAAAACGVPRSTLTRAIQPLEGRLGIRLVERTTRRVALTEAGELYYARCRRVLEEAEEADLAMNALAASPRGTLRIGAPVAFSRMIIGPMLADFLA